jgi:hypothetical protein
VENLGNSTLVTFMIINLVLLLGYLMDGREAIQATILEVINKTFEIYQYMNLCV